MGKATENIRLSVIVPFFNAEKDLKHCVVSLVRQVESGMELILVNDGSTDSSRTVLQETLQELGHPTNVHVLENAKNSGSAFSRQVGLDKAQGEYFIFCDADDWIEDGMYADLLACADERKADVVCSPFFYDFENGSKVVGFRNGQFPSLNDAPLDTVHFSLCNKIIRRSIATEHGISFFPDVNCWEDLGFVSRVLMFAGRVEIVDKPYYHYIKTSGRTLSTASMKRVLEDHLKLVPLMERWLDAEDSNLAEKYAGFVKFLKFTAKIKLLRGKDKDIRRWKKLYPEANRGIMKYRNVPLHYRILFFTVNQLPVSMVDFIFKKIL